jgi:DNA-binding response OmpR family regulator
MSAPGTERQKRVLVIDDSALTLAMTRNVLESAGFDVATAQDLTALEARTKEAAPDVILVDVQMPEAFGDDVAMTLRLARGMSAPILLVSSIDEAELARRASNAEVDGYVSKRRGLDELVRRVREVIRKRSGGT